MSTPLAPGSPAFGFGGGYDATHLDTFSPLSSFVITRGERSYPKHGLIRSGAGRLLEQDRKLELSSPLPPVRRLLGEVAAETRVLPSIRYTIRFPDCLLIRLMTKLT